MVGFLFLFVALFCSLSLQQQDISYTETPLPNKSSISVGKQNGVVWPIAIIGTFSLPQSYTGPAMMQFAADEINGDDTLIPGVKLQLHYCECNNSQSDAVLAALYEVLDKKVKGIAGGFPSQETVSIQLVSKIFAVPQISARANTDDLSDKTNYPYFARTTLADSNQDKAILQIFAEYGWERAILIYTNEQYGISGNSLMLNTDLEIFSVKISTDAVVNYTDAFSQIDKFVNERGIRVFLFFMLPPNFMPFMFALNSTYAGSQYAYVITAPVASSMIEYPGQFAPVMPNLDGAILVSAAVGDGDIYKKELPKWDALDPKEYPGLRPDPYSFWNWYDTIYIFAHALDSLMKQRNAASNLTAVLSKISGPDYFKAITQVNFMGATGPVVFDSDANLIANAGVWNLRNGTLTQLGTFYGNSSTLEMQLSPVFFGGRTDVPPDSYVLPIVERPRSIKIAMGFFTALGFIITCTVGFFLSTQPVAFAKSGRFYCGIIIFGAILALLAAVFAIPEPTDALCLAYPWFLGMGFILVFGCLFLRTWALFQVFRAAEQMKKTNFNPLFIMRILAVFIVVEFVLLIVWSTVDPPKVKLVNIKGDTERQYTCGAGNIAFWGVFVGYKGVWMLFGAIISFMVRNVREDYNQSAGLGMAVYNCFSITVIAIVLGFILHNTPNIVVIVQVMAILLAFITTLILLFSRQIYCVVTGKPIDKIPEGFPQTPYNTKSAKTSSGNAKSGSLSPTHSQSAKSKEVEVELA